MPKSHGLTFHFAILNQFFEMPKSHISKGDVNYRFLVKWADLLSLSMRRNERECHVLRPEGAHKGSVSLLIILKNQSAPS